MASSLELQTDQKRRLYQLLRVEKAENRDKTLNELIIATKAEMQQEDVAWVEKMILEL